MTPTTMPLALLLIAGADPASLGPVPADTVRVYVVRHAESLSNLTPPPKLPERELDALTEAGRAQAAALGAALRAVEVTLILHSPTGRTRETAAAIRGTRNAPVREERALRRIDLGESPAGTPLTDRDRVAAWQSGADPRPAEGESMVDVGQRMLDLLLSLRKEHAGHGVVCVTHSDPIGALLGHLHGTPGAARYPPGIPLASITVIDVGPDGPKERLAKYEPPAH